MKLKRQFSTGFLLQPLRIGSSVHFIQTDLFGNTVCRYIDKVQSVRVNTPERLVFETDAFIYELFPDQPSLNAVPGKRVRLIDMKDPYPGKLVPGSEGMIEFIDDVGTIHMRWDCGSSLGLVPGVDKFIIL